MTTASSVSRRSLFGLAQRVPARVAPAAAAAVAAISDTCIETWGTACRACEGACAMDAIRFRPKLGGGSALAILADACTGCGDCIGRCPTGAITLCPRAQTGAAS